MRSSSSPGRPSYLPWATCGPGVLGHLDPLALGLHGVGAAGHGACATISFQKKGFQAKPRLRDKRPSVRPSVPSPGFPEQRAFMRLPRLPRPPPAAHYLLSLPLWSACLFAVQRAGFLLFFSFLSPSGTLQANPLWGQQGLGRWRGLGAHGASPQKEQRGTHEAPGRGQHGKWVPGWLAQQLLESPGICWCLGPSVPPSPRSGEHAPRERCVDTHEMMATCQLTAEGAAVPGAAWLGWGWGFVLKRGLRSTGPASSAAPTPAPPAPALARVGKTGAWLLEFWRRGARPLLAAGQGPVGWEGGT